MAETEAKEEVPNVDFSKVAALQQKRTLAFVNHFVTSTSQFLNNFLCKCEQKLMEFERQLEKVEAAMILLETRLASIPEVNTEEFSSKQEVTNLSTELPQEQTTKHETTQLHPSQKQENVKKPNEEIQNKNAAVVQIPLEYEKFVKMVQVGVPLAAVKLKVSLEGLDPNVLENVLKK